MHDLVLPLGSPGYLERLRASSDDPAEQLREAKLIDSAKALFRWDLWLAANRIELPDLHYPLRFDRSSMSIELAKQGSGLALDSLTLCLPELRSGELAPFSLDYPVIDFPGYWFVCPPRHLNRRIVSRFSDWITQAGAEHEAEARALLKGLGCRAAARSVDWDYIADSTIEC